jgi:predicted glycosyltransferase
MRDARRFMLYSHDTYGLGHLARTLTLAGYLRSRWPGTSQLIVTGSPLAHYFRLPEDADYLKLPSVVKVAADHYEARSLALRFEEVRALRSEILLSVARNLAPDALIVDNVPAGLEGELKPALLHLKEASPSTRLVLGLRDIVDDAARVRRAWTRDGVYELLEEVYDLVLVYGDRQVYDVVAEYGLRPRAAAKTRYVGYLRRESSTPSASQARADLHARSNRLVLVMAGGGGDGYYLLRTALDALRLRPEAARFDWVLVGGPLMPARHQHSLEHLAAGTPGAHFRRFVPDLAAYVAAADAVVSMGGYNSICEILTADRPSVVVPRVDPRTEQLIRAEALRKRSRIRVIHPRDLTPSRLIDEVDELVELESPASDLPDLEGLQGAAGELEEVLAGAGASVRIASAAGS